MAFPIITGLDIGTHSLKMAVAKRKEQGGELEILGLVQEQSAGVRKGAVVKPEELTNNLLSLKQRMENITSQKIREVFVNMGGSNLQLLPSRGIVAVSRADGQISKEDVERVFAAANVFPLPSNYQVLDLFPQQFILDGKGEIKDVVGMKGMRLEAEVLALCAFSPYFKNLTEAVLNADLEILDLVPSPLMAGLTLLTPRQKELGVALIDMGAGTTSLAVFEEGDLIDAAVFPVGSENITSDIAIGLRCDHEVAERIKKEFGSLRVQSGKRTEKIDVPESAPFSFSLKALSRIIEARMKEIFQFVAKELKRIEKQGKLPGGIVLGGGGSKLGELSEFVKRELKLPVKLGSAQAFPLDTDPLFFGVLGLIMRSPELREEPSFPWRAKGIVGRLQKMLKVFVP